MDAIEKLIPVTKKVYIFIKISREELKIVKGGRRYCQSYVMIAWCNDTTVTDTVCYDLDSQQSRDEAYACMTHNGQLFNVYTCGSEDYGA